MHQGRGLQRQPRALARQALSGQLPQLLVHLRQERFRIAGIIRCSRRMRRRGFSGRRHVKEAGLRRVARQSRAATSMLAAPTFPNL